jgi:leucyl/phenylalanyl-tRNA--protein transferase
MRLPWLDSNQLDFPDTSLAMAEPNGLLAAGGQLNKEWLLTAYSKGIFPWFNEGDPILWWSPSPRMVLFPDQLHISRSLKKALKKQDYQVTINKSFSQVMLECAAPRKSIEEDPGTWITDEMLNAYIALHKLGFAHSIEVWRGNDLVGGLYGVAIGKVFFGESMFSRATNGSKIGFTHLVEWLKQWQYELIDCQIYNDHLSSLGAIEIDRRDFELIIHKNAAKHLPHTLNNVGSNDEQWQPREITLAKEFWGNEQLRRKN